MAGVRRGSFTCVGWQVTLCDPIWQVMSRSSEMGFTDGVPMKSYIGLYLFTFTFSMWIQTLNQTATVYKYTQWQYCIVYYKVYFTDLKSNKGLSSRLLVLEINECTKFVGKWSYARYCTIPVSKYTAPVSISLSSCVQSMQYLGQVQLKIHSAAASN